MARDEVCYVRCPRSLDSYRPALIMPNYRKSPKVSPSMYKPSKYKPPKTDNVENPPLNDGLNGVVAFTVIG